MIIYACIYSCNDIQNVHGKICCLNAQQLGEPLVTTASMPEKPARPQTARPNLPHLRTTHRTPEEQDLAVLSSGTTWLRG